MVWRKLVIHLIYFWRGLSEASQQDLEVPGATQSIGILVTEEEPEDDIFSKDLRKIVMKGIATIEKLQTLVSKVCMKQLSQLRLDLPHMSIVHTIALEQLELGGAQLKTVTLELLTELHQVRFVVVEVEIFYHFSLVSVLAVAPPVCGLWRPSYWFSCWSSSSRPTCSLRRWSFSPRPGLTSSPGSSL